MPEFLTAARRAVAARLSDDLARVFGDRLRVVVAYEPVTGAGRDKDDVHTLALVDRLSIDDLSSLLTVVPAWHKAGLATPLLLGEDEFRRTLDVFPVEYQSIVARHEVLRGSWPGAPQVSAADLRRGCERQIKALLIHLREGYLETHGAPRAIADLMRSGVPAFRSSLQNVARLRGALADTGDDLIEFARAGLQLDPVAVREVLDFPAGAERADATALLPRFVALVEQLWRVVDADGLLA